LAQAIVVPHKAKLPMTSVISHGDFAKSNLRCATFFPQPALTGIEDKNSQKYSASKTKRLEWW
jgi:hypothetical protein